MGRTYKCLYCEKRFERAKLINHIDRFHQDMIPEGYSGARLVFDMINKTTGGKCRVCGAPTDWNGTRYNVLCNNPKCKEKMREEYKRNMLRVKGTYNILNDPEQQKIMLANRKISGKYQHSDGGIIQYTGQYEKAFLEFIDNFLQIPSNDIISPGPTMEYEYEGKKHIYIPDFYLLSINCIIEIKDGGNNVNNRQSSSMIASREKTIEKERIITDRGEFNYLRLTNNQFEQLIDLFMAIKEKIMNGDNSKTIRINESIDLVAANEVFSEATADELITLYHGSDIGDLKVILPRSMNAGTKNQGDNRFRYSSFWFKKKEYAMTFAVYDIFRYHMPKEISNASIVDNDMKLCIIKDYKYDSINFIETYDCYVYEAQVPAINIEYGHTKNFPEFTVDIKVIPKRKYKLSRSEKFSRVKFISEYEFDKIAKMYTSGTMTWGETDPIRLAINDAIYFKTLGNTNKYLDAMRSIMNLESAYDALNE